MTLSHSPNIVRDGLVLALDAANPKSYPGSGTTWYDLSKNKNSVTDITLFNNQTKTFDFDFSQPTISVTNHIDYLISSSWTVQMILYPPTGVSTSWNYLFGGANGVGGYWFFHAQGNWGVYSDFFEGNAYLGYSSVRLGGSIPYDKFSIITMTAKPYDLNLNKVSFDIYVNGEFKTNLIHTYSSRTTHSISLRYIGSAGRKGQYNLSSFCNWSRELSAEEIKQNFDSLRGRYGI